jgi:diguanylate cyclase (GGDEF)-like protein
MDLQRLARAGTPPEVSVLAIMALVMGAVCLGSVAFPLVEDAPRAAMLGFGLAGVTIAVLLALAGPRVSRLALHAVVVLVTVMHGLMVAVAATERGLMLAALGQVWTAVYVAFFFHPATARRYAALLIAVLGASMLAARAPTGVSVWLIISVMVWVAVALLTTLNARLRAEAHTDSLTGLLNRAGFAVAAARHRAMAARRGEPTTLVVIDLDDFKLVNDRGGHALGDRLLVELAGAWTASLRPGDLLARFGGDEFVLLLTGIAEDQTEHVLARLRRAHPAPWTAGAVVCEEAESLDESLARADAGLYSAKQPHGRADYSNPPWTRSSEFGVRSPSSVTPAGR